MFSMYLGLVHLVHILRGSEDLNSRPQDCIASALHSGLFPLTLHSFNLLLKSAKRRDTENCKFPEKDQRSSRQDAQVRDLGKKRSQTRTMV